MGTGTSLEDIMLHVLQCPVLPLPGLLQRMRRLGDAASNWSKGSMRWRRWNSWRRRGHFKRRNEKSDYVPKNWSGSEPTCGTSGQMEVKGTLGIVVPLARNPNYGHENERLRFVIPRFRAPNLS